jgi:coenzyme F420-reducing hydrogenase delta subunit
MFNLSSAMGGRFAEIVEEMTAKIKELGPTFNKETVES